MDGDETLASTGWVNSTRVLYTVVGYTKLRLDLFARAITGKYNCFIKTNQQKSSNHCSRYGTFVACIENIFLK